MQPKKRPHSYVQIKLELIHQFPVSRRVRHFAALKLVRLSPAMAHGLRRGAQMNRTAP
jgi:hypothetical protein